MTSSRIMLAFGCCLTVVIVASSVGVAAVPDTPAKTVLVHYMPWYASKPVSGQWGWHWTMNHFDPERKRPDGRREAAAHDYPLIGLYDSGDPAALECQVLLMKLAGIDGTIIDWYGTARFRDYAAIHTNTQRLIHQLRRAGLKYAVCYEDQTIKHLVNGRGLSAAEALGQGRRDLKWLAENCFRDDRYVTIDGRPVLLVFGPQYFQRRPWRQLLSGSPQRPLLYALPHLAEKTGSDGAFGWPPVTGGREIKPTEWNDYLDSLYARPAADKSVVAIAFPGFRDIYKQAQLHDSYGRIDDRDGRTFAETFARARQSNARIIQIATWNDYGEGTVVEPTRKHGYRYLETIQRASNVRSRFTAADLRLPVMLYNHRKRGEGAARREQLDAAAAALFAGKCDRARSLLNAAAERDRGS